MRAACTTYSRDCVRVLSPVNTLQLGVSEVVSYLTCPQCASRAGLSRAQAKPLTRGLTVTYFVRFSIADRL